jgi:hypothetical protein
MAREVVEAAGAEIPVKIVPREDHVDSSSINCGSNVQHERDVGSQSDEDPIADVDQASRSYYFGPSTIIVTRIREMSSLSYFADVCLGRKLFISLRLMRS